MITNDDMDHVFHALAHQTRRRILDLVRDQPGQAVGELAKGFDVSRIAIMNHLKVLEDAGLIISEKDGRTRRLYLNAMPIQAIHERWLDTYSAYWADRMSLIKHAAEHAAKANSKSKEA
ncbi:helix-turn-helix transcriptional regulator [Hyphomonas sp. FCG-A18]|uniref:ArsR/SmtB family transcription factor n=1 Tax=Hyphomonas sp. FCG-A18 TaxID=3080019 RepID=UPI002B2CFD71|nr:helix-turn-helix transcriptional regulator [Hyphomonas sp. FCG-A18]